MPFADWLLRAGGDGTGPGISKDKCSEFMDNFCKKEMQQRPMMMPASSGEIRHLNATIAAFLITRPPIGFIGWGWESDDRMWPKDNETGYEPFLLQPGTPSGLCKSEGGGVYSREWSNGKVTLDCNAWEAKLPFPSL